MNNADFANADIDAIDNMASVETQYDIDFAVFMSACCNSGNIDSLDTVDVEFDADIQLFIDALNCQAALDDEDVMSFDASDMCTGAAPIFNACDDDLLEMYFLQQAGSSSTARARRKSASAANDAQMSLFA